MKNQKKNEVINLLDEVVLAEIKGGELSEKGRIILAYVAGVLTPIVLWLSGCYIFLETMSPEQKQRTYKWSRESIGVLFERQ